MDISNLKPVERIVEILHPGTGDELGVKVTIISLNDPKMSKIKRNIQNKRLVLEKKGKSFDSAELEENENILLQNAVTGWIWEGDITFHDEKPEFNEKNFKAVIKELPWFKTQILEAIGDEKAFFLN